MNNLARKLRPTPELDYAEVVSMAGAEATVRLNGRELRALQSASCLLRPEPGDEALVSIDHTGRCFILAVLVRADQAAPQSLAFSGDVRLQVSEGSLQLMAAEDVTVAAGQTCSCLARNIQVLSDEAEARVERASFLGKVVRANVRLAALAAGAIETTAERCTRRLRDFFSFVEDQSEYQSRNSRHVVEETLTMHSRNAFHVADEIVKVDAEQVHLG